MMHRTAGIALFFVGMSAVVAHADKPVARKIAYFDYSEAVELRQGNVRAVVGPQAGGRVLEFSRDGANAMWFDEKEKKWTPEQKPMGSAGRFDYGPELVVKPHPAIWSGTWSAEITGTCSVRLISPRDASAGVQLIRDFQLDAPPGSAHLSCTQTIANISNETQELCHWGRSFSPGGGVALVPLGERPSRFPSKYAMYEDSALINVRNTDDCIRERDGFLEILGPPRKPKLGFDSYAGWLAYLMPGDLLFVKRFRTYPDRVYNEAAGLTLSMWYPPGARVELEPIGPRERLAPGERASFTEHWWLLSFPFPAQGESVDVAKLRETVVAHTSPP